MAPLPRPLYTVFSLTFNDEKQILVPRELLLVEVTTNVIPGRWVTRNSLGNDLLGYVVE